MKNYLLYMFLVLTLSCSIFRKSEKKFEDPIGFTLNNRNNNYRYNDFIERDSSIYGICIITDEFEDGNGVRDGKIVNGYKNGKFITGVEKYDSINKKFYYTKIFKEEYFKKGLRDSTFKQFDKNGNLIYETTFKKGTGLWKEFHANGKLYFEAYTKDGYFTDTLKLYNEKGELQEKILYNKEKVIFRQKMIIEDFPTDNK